MTGSTHINNLKILRPSDAQQLNGSQGCIMREGSQIIIRGELQFICGKSVGASPISINKSWHLHHSGLKETLLKFATTNNATVNAIAD